MQLYRLVYYSEAAEGLTVQDVREIAAKASVKNRANALTGGLLYCEGKFLQILEGGLHPVNKLFQRILLDLRHKNVNLIDFSKVHKRAFSGWEMSLVFFPTSNEFLPEYLRYSHETTFDPMNLDGDACIEFMQDLFHKRKLNQEKPREFKRTELTV
ncbi:MAG: BLUF domain-containing protein [Chloroherpetonaceae bacterium]|nr:BLUF domain-containing protein [Chloroherpetonaceae bacterium]